jgi:two-component system response regulator Irr
MNSGDGHEFVAIAKKLKPSPPVILVTAYADKDLAIRSANLRVFAFLEKPVDFSALTQAVGSAIEEKRREARNTSFESSKHSLEEDILLDANDFSVHFQGKKIVLTKVEFQILNVLIKSAGERISRSEITQRVWGRTKTSSNLLDSHLRNMRAKLPFLSERLKPIWGAGYIFLSRSDEN